MKLPDVVTTAWAILIFSDYSHCSGGNHCSSSSHLNALRVSTSYQE